MLIDWFTVGAQALNFLILVWLMKRFLYKPVLNAIDAREKKVAAELADADRKKKEAQAESADFKRRNDDFDRQRAALLSKATEAAEAERRRLLEEARAAADTLGAQRREGLRREEQALRMTILGQLRTEVLSVARKALKDLADAALEERVAATFVRRLREMKDPAKTAFAAALSKSTDPAVLRSAFDLTTEQRSSLQTALNQFFSADVRLRFEVAPDLIGGIDLTVGGLKMGWNVDNYLTSLGIEVDRSIEARAKAESAAKPANEPSVPAGRT